GKSTVSKCLSGRLHYGYLDTGALYRALAWKVQQEQLEPSNLSHIESLLSRTSLQLIADQNGFSIKLDGQSVIEKELRTPVISQLASSIAVLPIVREWLLPVQQAVGKAGGVVAEGRDMGTRVFPNADVKFFLEADVNVRARRRQQELAEKGQPVHLDTVRDEMVMRDTRDLTRAHDPLRPAPEAIMIETSQKPIEDILSQMMGMIVDRL
ncbi:MAG: (d)CMP kinase, partial [Nitrospirota bacterium]|nr:(d)CMP kinase [Nitrospirota bacterium]MDX2420400.1 (d)CMP kinase [Nitrospirota bacterium]